MPRIQLVALVAASALSLTGVAGCASSGDDVAAASSPAAGSGCTIEATDTWAKAADSGMTAVFGKLTNTGSQEVVVNSATSDAAGKVEVHEVVDKDGVMVMQPKPGGLVIATGASAALAPGADHIMLMDLTGPIKAGDPVIITLQCADGGTAQITAEARTFTGADEQYKSSASPSAGEMGGEMSAPAPTDSASQ